MKSAVGLADLARMLRALPAAQHADAAALLGLEAEVVSRTVGVGMSVMVAEQPAAAPSPIDERARFLRVEAASETGAPIPARPPPVARLSAAEVRSVPGRSLPPTPPLAPWSTIVSRMRAALRGSRRGRDPDVRALVRIWARGEPLQQVPRRRRETWAQAARIWIDRSHRLTPFWDDQDAVCDELTRLCGVGAIVRRYLDGARQADLRYQRGDLVGLEPLDPSVPVLVLGDLGFLGTATDRVMWRCTAGRLVRAGVRVTALVPCPTERWDAALARTWRATPWERGCRRRPRGTPTERVERLLRLVAPTGLAQIGLVRALRHLLPADEADASTEVDLWRHADVRAADVTGLVLTSAASARWRGRFFSEEKPPIPEQVSRLIAAWHGGWRAELLHAETVAWLAAGAADPPGNPAEAMAFMKRVDGSQRGGRAIGSMADTAKRYSRHMLAALPAEAYVRIPQLVDLWAHAFDGVADARLPATISPAQLPGRGVGGPQTWMVGQRGGALVFAPFDDEGDGIERAPASQVATIAAATLEVWVQRGGDDSAAPTLLAPGTTVPVHVDERLTLRTDLATVSLGVWERQPWAVAAGRDRYGLWAAFEVEGVRQRMRWIPPGRFLMGSPGGEAGRYKDEGPPHLVTITAGYWLGETPVTQALWRVVMGNNPSRFVSDERPVEQVSWNDCQAFIERVNARLDGARAALTHLGERLRLRLPTEAEWERACRAGTTTATWVGDLAIEGANNAPVLDDIAWYGGNSGIGFELDNGEDSSGWPEKQHPHARAGTHPVGPHDPEPRQPNPYGLHDMLGNVYEWCQDAGKGWGEPYPYTEAPVTDPVHVQGPYRVFRGGSWNSDARSVRAAYRVAVAPDVANGYLGLRLAGGQAAPGKQAGEPRSGDGGEPRSGGASAPRRGGGRERRSGERGRGAGRDPARAEERDATTPGDSGPHSGATRTTTVTTHDGPRGRRRR